MQLLLPQTRYPNAGRDDRVLPPPARRDRARCPAVTASAVSTTLPMTGSDIGIGFAPEGRAVDPNVAHVGGVLRRQPGLLLDAGHPHRPRPRLHGARRRARAGRGRHQRDDGREVLAGRGSDRQARARSATTSTGPREIVGIVGDVKQTNLTDAVAAADVHAVRADAVAVPDGGRADDGGAGGGGRIAAAGAGAPRSGAGGRRNPDASTSIWRGRSRRRASRRSSSAPSPAWRCCSPASASTA